MQPAHNKSINDDRKKRAALFQTLAMNNYTKGKNIYEF